VRRALEGTPGRLRAAGVGTVLACLLFALLGGSAFQARGGALDRARSDAAQLVRVQQIATDLVKADSAFTTGYLSFGSEPTAQLQEYRAAVADAAEKIATASAANPADAAELAVVSRALAGYTAEVASARAANRQGFPVAAGYLRRASVLLRSEVDGKPNALPTLQRLVEDNTARVEASFAAARAAVWRLVGAALVALATLAVVQVWLARRTRRVLNLPLVAASVLVLAAVVVGSVVAARTQSSTNRVQDTPYAATLALSGARIAAFTGKSNESIALIYLGTGGDYATPEKTYGQDVATATTQLGTAASRSAGPVGQDALAAWTGLHDQRWQQAQTDWLGAVTQAIAPVSEQASANAQFDAFDTASDAALTTQAEAVASGLGDSRGGLVVTGWAVLVLGMLAAAAAWWGLSQRLEEYR
jgi:hypothetical protein